MKKLVLALLVCCIAAASPSARAEDKKSAEVQLKDLIAKVGVKIKADKRTEADLADELKEFDTLLAEHKDEKTEEVARILFMKAMLYVEVLELPDKGVPLVKKLQADFPDTDMAKQGEKLLASIAQQAESAKLQSQLVDGAVFPNFEEKDVDGKPLSIVGFKGKVVLVDFWATWCGPCVRELPNVIKAYEKYHDKGFEIVGVSLDQDESTLRAFLKKNKMTWQQYFDGKGWQNKVSTKYGIGSIPATFLLDKEGKILAKDLRGEDLATRLEKLLAK